MKGEAMRKVSGILVIGLLVWSLFSGAVSGEIATSPLTEAYIDLTAYKAKRMIEANPNIILLDVRTQDDFLARGHINGARCVPLSELKERIDELDKDKEVIVYCNSGMKSKPACEILAENGFENVYNMFGGIKAWTATGFALNAPSLPSYTSSEKNSVDSRIDSALENDKPAFMFFYTDWCHFSQKQKLIIYALEQEYSEKVVFIYVNAKENQQAMDEFGVTGFPTMVLIWGKADDRYLYRKFVGYTESDALAEELDRVMESGAAGNVRGMSFEEGQRSDLGCSSCINHSNLNINISQVNLTADEFLKEISNESESLELYNRANERGYTKLRHSQKIWVDNENGIVKGTLVSEEGREVQLVKFSSQGSSFSFSQENLTADEFLAKISNDSESLELYNRANKMGYTRLNQSQELSINSEISTDVGTLVSEQGKKIYLVKLSSQEYNESYLMEKGNTTVTIYRESNSEEYELSSVSINIDALREWGACTGFCLNPNLIERPIEDGLILISGHFAAEHIVHITCGACAIEPTKLTCLVCVAGLGLMGYKVGKILDCADGCYNHKCYFANYMPEDKCCILYRDTLYGKAEYLYLHYSENSVCYHNRFRNPYNDDIFKCCSYREKDELRDGYIYSYQNSGSYADLWYFVSSEECAGVCSDDAYYPPVVECTQDGISCIPESTSIPVSDFCGEKGYEKGQCGKPADEDLCEANELPKEIKSYPGDLWCWSCGAGYEEICSDDSDCGGFSKCVPSCTGGASHCCPSDYNYWSETSGCVEKCECNDNSDCPTCRVCTGGYCEPDDTAISNELRNQGFICCDGLLHVPLGVDPNPLITPACCNDNDCDTASGEVCYDHLCTKTQGSCYYEEECAQGYWCMACEGKQPHCCLEGKRWDGTECVVDCHETCPSRKCMEDYNGYDYSCSRCTEDEISQSLCEETSDGCFYGDPDASFSPCEQCCGDCVRGYCESSVGCVEYKLPDDHGYMDCTNDPDIKCDCPSTCAGALRLYDPMNWILPSDTGYLYKGCLYHGCYNCGADDLICSNGNCVSGDPIGDFICDNDQCMPDTTIFYNDFAHRKTSGECDYSIWDYRQKCVPSSQRYTFPGVFCEETSEDYRPNPFQVDEHLWAAAIYNTKMKNRDELREKICYEEKSWGCYENDDRYLEVYECKSPVPSNYWICDDSCYDPAYYECCMGEWLVLKDHDGDGIQDHKCCIAGIESDSCRDPNLNGEEVDKNIVVYENFPPVNIMNDPQNCGGCGWKCTNVVNGACMDIERDYTHVCTGTKPQCCHGKCIEPSPVLSIKEVSFYPENVIEGAEETILVAVDYADPYNYGKNVEINLTLYVDNSSIGAKLLSLHAEAANRAYFFWKANLSAGEHELKATIDLINNITICGEREQKKIFMVLQKPDIAVENLMIDTTGIKSGDTVPITVTLHNLGSSDTNEFVTTLSVDSDFQAYNMTALTAGESQQISFNWTAILGEHNLAITADSFPVPNGIIPETNELNNEVSKTVNVLIEGKTAPTLSFAFEPGYFFDAVEPDTGNESTIFEYRVEYIDYDNHPSAAGHPKLWLDINGDGDYDDIVGEFAEGSFAMTEVNVSDTIYSDGKLYSYSTSLPCGSNHTYKFSALDVTGMDATGVVNINKGPYVDCFKPWKPYIPTPDETAIQIQDNKAIVNLTLSGDLYRAETWGETVREGTNLSANATIQHKGIPVLLLMELSHVYDLGELEVGKYIFIFKSYGEIVKSKEFEISTPTLPVHNINTGKNYSCIQDAISDESTRDDHTVIVDPGNYTENVLLFNKSLTIRSSSGNPSDTIVQAADPNEHVFNVSIDSVNISGFTVKGATGWQKGGIYLCSVEHCNISNNIASNNDIGINVWYGGNNTLTKNTALYNDFGFYLRKSSNNTLYNNTASDNTDYDFYSHEDAYNNAVEDLTIASYPTTISFTYANGVGLKGVETAPGDTAGKANISKYVNVTEVTADSWIFMNVSYEDGDLSGVEENSLRMWKHNGTDWTEVPGTNGVNTAENYVYAKITEFGSIFAPLGNVTGAKLEINKTGVPDPVPAGGTLNYTISVNNTGNATATNVTVKETYDENVTFVMAVPAPSPGNDTWKFTSLNASETRWINISVTVNASVLNGTVLHNIVNVTCDEGVMDTDTENTTVFVTPVLNCTCGDICVNETGWWRGGGAFKASNTPIQHAVDNATAGDTICVKDGIYYENVVVDKSLTLLGADKDSTIIDGGGKGDVVYVTADYVNISNFTLRNSSGDLHSNLKLFSSSNSKIVNNNVCNSTSGIYLKSSCNNEIIKNNVFNIREAGRACQGIRIGSSSANRIGRLFYE
jgi:uncharacterized repeat protein (TIGR01451 family)